jgi:hypothetical protein
VWRDGLNWTGVEFPQWWIVGFPTSGHIRTQSFSRKTLLHWATVKWSCYVGWNKLAQDDCGWWVTKDMRRSGGNVLKELYRQTVYTKFNRSPLCIFEDANHVDDWATSYHLLQFAQGIRKKHGSQCTERGKNTVAIYLHATTFSHAYLSVKRGIFSG